MKRRILMLVAAVALTGLLGASAGAQKPKIKKPIGPGCFYSRQLKAHFRIETMHIPGYTFRAARIVSRPRPNSPLRQLKLKKGDVITRLDGIRVTHYRELENHIARTNVRYIRKGCNRVRCGVIYIRNCMPKRGGCVVLP